MSTETTANADAANAVVEPIKPATQAAPAKQKYEVDYDPNNPPWLAGKLTDVRQKAEENARKAVLEELGGDPDAIKKLLADEKKRAEAQKSLEQKNAEANEALKSKDARNKELEESVKSYADGQLAALSEAQRAAVVAVAGNDPPKQLKAIEALRPTWAIVGSSQTTTQGSQSGNGSTEATQTQQTTQTAPVVHGKPATQTAPPANAPPPAGGPPVIENRLETYTAMTDPSSPHYAPFMAATFYSRYRHEIEAAKKSRGAPN